MHRRTRVVAGLVLFLAGIPAGWAQQADLEQRLLQLEAEIREIRRQLSQPAGAPAVASPAAPADAPAAGAGVSDSRNRDTETARPETTGSGTMDSGTAAGTLRQAASAPVLASLERGRVQARYFLVGTELGIDLPSASPLAEGLVTLGADIRLDPARYGVESRIGRAYERFRDPVAYRSAGLLLEGRFEAATAGVYRFEIAPKPTREGGGSPVTSEMGIWLQLGDREVVALPGIRSWRRQVVSVELAEGWHDARLWVIANSPGYGVSPIASRVEIGVMAPGFAETRPLAALLAVDSTR